MELLNKALEAIGAKARLSLIADVQQTRGDLSNPNVFAEG